MHHNWWILILVGVWGAGDRFWYCLCSRCRLRWEKAIWEFHKRRFHKIAQRFEIAGQFCEIALCEIPKFPKKGGVKKGNLGISQNFMIFRQVLRWELRIVILKNQSSQKMRFLRINIMRTLILKNQHFSELWFLRIILWLLMLILKNQHFMRTLILKNHSFCERWFLRITLFYT